MPQVPKYKFNLEVIKFSNEFFDQFPFDHKLPSELIITKSSQPI